MFDLFLRRCLVNYVHQLPFWANLFSTLAHTFVWCQNEIFEREVASWRTLFVPSVSQLQICNSTPSESFHFRIRITNSTGFVYGCNDLTFPSVLWKFISYQEWYRKLEIIVDEMLWYPFDLSLEKHYVVSEMILNHQVPMSNRRKFNAV